jgi:glutathione S-transferase
MERRLAEAEWLAGPAFSLADIALFAYTHMAGDGGYDLAPFPGVARWLARVAALPGHVTIAAPAS